MNQVESIRVLLIEDEAGDAYLVKTTLKSTPEINFEITWVESLALAKQALVDTIFEVILLDLSLPDSEGLETVEIAKQIAGDLPIIILTGHGDTEFALTALKAGANDYMVKGDFGFDGLARAIRYALLRVEMEAHNKVLVAALEAAANGIIITDKDAHIKWANPAFSDLTGYQLDEVIGRKPNELVSSGVQDEQFYYAMWTKLLAGEHWHGEVVNKHKDGTLYHEDLSISPVKNSRGEVINFIGIKENISERKILENELRIAATAFETQEGILITDANSAIIKVNNAFSWITGYCSEEVIGKTPQILQSNGHDKEFYETMWLCIKNTDGWQGEVWNKRKNGQIYPQYLTITAVKNGAGVVTNYVATFTDITERKVTEETISHLAFYDLLTELPNRRLLEERLKHGIDVSRRSNMQMAVLMIDLDKFKAVNDNFGHAAGDDLLKQVAERIKSCVREVDTVARLGGDEFVVLLENVNDLEQINRISTDIIQSLSHIFSLRRGNDASIGASIGISLYPQHGNDWNVLMDLADVALYCSKDNGKGRATYFSDELLNQ
jgi:diguanylate cyclase (GGDEF)-like protein/PAS domain S-box-containing protein